MLHSLDPAKFLRQTFFRSPVGTVNSQYHRSKGGQRKKDFRFVDPKNFTYLLVWCKAAARRTAPRGATASMSDFCRSQLLLLGHAFAIYVFLLLQIAIAAMSGGCRFARSYS